MLIIIIIIVIIIIVITVIIVITIEWDMCPLAFKEPLSSSGHCMHALLIQLVHRVALSLELMVTQITWDAMSYMFKVSITVHIQ